MKEKIEKILNETLPEGAWREVSYWTGISRESRYVAIKFASADYLINGVRGQRPETVSLNLNLNSMELEPQIFGGNGGRWIYRKPRKDDPREKYLALARITIPFRKPKPTEEAVLKAIKRFAERWIQAIKDNVSELCYDEQVNYKKLLNI